MESISKSNSREKQIEQMLSKYEGKRQQQQQEQTKDELVKIQERVNLMMEVYDKDTDKKNGVTHIEYCNTIEELQSICESEQMKRRHDNQFKVYVVGLQTGLDKRNKMLQSLCESLQSLQSRLVNETNFSEFSDPNLKEFSLKEVLCTLNQSFERLVRIKSAMRKVFNINSINFNMAEGHNMTEIRNFPIEEIQSEIDITNQGDQESIVDISMNNFSSVLEKQYQETGRLSSLSLRKELQNNKNVEDPEYIAANPNRALKRDEEFRILKSPTMMPETSTKNNKCEMKIIDFDGKHKKIDPPNISITNANSYNPSSNLPIMKQTSNLRAITPNENATEYLDCSLFDSDKVTGDDCQIPMLTKSPNSRKSNTNHSNTFHENEEEYITGNKMIGNTGDAIYSNNTTYLKSENNFGNKTYENYSNIQSLNNSQNDQFRSNCLNALDSTINSFKMSDSIFIQDRTTDEMTNFQSNNQESSTLAKLIADESILGENFCKTPSGDLYSAVLLLKEQLNGVNQLRVQEANEFKRKIWLKEMEIEDLKRQDCYESENVSRTYNTFEQTDSNPDTDNKLKMMQNNFSAKKTTERIGITEILNLMIEIHNAFIDVLYQLQNKSFNLNTPEALLSLKISSTNFDICTLWMNLKESLSVITEIFNPIGDNQEVKSGRNDFFEAISTYFKQNDEILGIQNSTLTNIIANPNSYLVIHGNDHCSLFTSRDFSQNEKTLIKCEAVNSISQHTKRRIIALAQYYINLTYLRWSIFIKYLVKNQLFTIAFEENKFKKANIPDMSRTFIAKIQNQMEQILIRRYVLAKCLTEELIFIENSTGNYFIKPIYLAQVEKKENIANLQICNVNSKLLVNGTQNHKFKKAFVPTGDSLKNNLSPSTSLDRSQPKSLTLNGTKISQPLQKINWKPDASIPLQ